VKRVWKALLFTRLYYLGVQELLIRLPVVMVIFDNAAPPLQGVFHGWCLKARPSEPTRKEKQINGQSAKIDN
jgi:hypothetical protein